ncbi:MAG: hypothetical protein ACOYOQ_00480 [Microthrixaceae bacterium]
MSGYRVNTVLDSEDREWEVLRDINGEVWGLGTGGYSYDGEAVVRGREVLYDVDVRVEVTTEGLWDIEGVGPSEAEMLAESPDILNAAEVAALLAEWGA